MLEETVSGFLLFLASALGAALTALWAGMAIWTWRDIRARSRDNLAHVTATALVALLNVIGLLVYLMLRPRETLAEAYERSLEEEALLQGIEEKPMCPGCGRPTQMAWQVCPYCHTRLRKPCINCQQLLELSWTLCPYCATVQASDAAPRSRRRTPQPAPLEYVEGDGEIA